MMETICGDNVEVMAGFPDQSIHLVVTSPPYDNLRTYGGYSWDFPATVAQLHRLMVDGGVVVWIVNDETVKGSESGTSFRQALGFIDAGFLLHDTMIWQKPNFSHPAKNRYHQVFEYMFIFSKGKPRVFNPIMDRPNLYAGKGPLGKNTVSNRDGTKGMRPVNRISDMGMRHNVWLMNTTGQEKPCSAIKHPATFPQKLAKEHILTWSDPGDTVLDPFLGSGTTLAAAQEWGRHGIGIDCNIDYVMMSRERLRDS